MKSIYLLKYSVKGIKSLDELVTLSFYKKTITKDMDAHGYNIKGIYGMNGSGKSGIMSSMQILKNILIDPNYLSNPISQNSLDAVINKKLGELYIEAEYIVEFEKVLKLFRYEVGLAKNKLDMYTIRNEQLSVKTATSKNDAINIVYRVDEGTLDLKCVNLDAALDKIIIEKTANLLDKSSLSSLFAERVLEKVVTNEQINFMGISLLMLLSLGKRIHVYMAEEDTHIPFIISRLLKANSVIEVNNSEIDALMGEALRMDVEDMNMLSVEKVYVAKDNYETFEKEIRGLYEFLHIFKSDLENVEIEKKEDGDKYICELVMTYDGYRVNAEFESTGIKKLIKLYAYIKEMKRGGIVFIDEFDANLHDVYLCALLEYLMEYGEGQLCFTTHNIGPMDILRRNNNSIDFLSVNHRIYSWKKSGNYSPSNLYRNGMIEGSPFNVDSIDFIDAFGGQEDD